MVFVERQQQLASFAAALADSQRGTGRVLAVTGPLTSGKTTLLRMFTERASTEGFLVLHGAGARIERELPLSLVNQFCQDFPSTTGHPSRAQLIREVHTTAVRHGRGVILPGQRLTATLHRAAATLLAASEEQPVLLTVDDLHHVDQLSLHCLLYLARRMRSARILMVVTGGDPVEPTDRQLYAELMEFAAGGQLALPPLSSRGVGELLTEALGTEAPRTLVDACTRASGGNPLLTRELIDDLRTLEAEEIGLDRHGHVVPGPGYLNAVRRYLERCDPITRRVLAATALFDERPPAGSLTLARLAEVDTAAARRALAGLEAAGLVSDCRFPHPLGRQAVLDQLPPEQGTALHLRAARLLYEEGSAPQPVARHLLAAGRTTDWAGPVLGAAAEALLAEGDVELAIATLRLAHDGAQNEAERAALKVALLQAEWRTDPAAAGHRLGQLALAARAGQLTVAQQVTTAHCLLWLGRPAEAVEVLAGLATLEVQPAEAAEIRFMNAWTRFSHPGLLSPESEPSEPPRRTSETTTSTRDALAHALETVLVKGPNSGTVIAAEQALQRYPLSGGTPAPLAAALTVLIYADHLETAALWTDRLLTQASACGAASWRAMLLAIRGDITLRQGQLADAQRFGEAALVTMSRESWSTAVGVPIATVLQTLTARGRLDDARRYLDEAVPEAMFQTIWGLQFLRARGRFYLATGRPEAALDDFDTCGELMGRWSVDLPALIPWRIESARAHLALQQNDQARTLAECQLTQLGPEPSRTKAAALRVLAAVAPLPQRPTLLRDAAEMLRTSGDRLELALALADLGHAQRALGEFHRARMSIRRAYDLATDCHADALRQTLLPDVDDTVLGSAEETDTDALNTLSDAERRVAALAAQGATNRQIANKLFVTVSTVEQHLTKVYRKLNVTRRADLLIKLGPRISNIA